MWEGPSMMELRIHQLAPMFMSLVWFSGRFGLGPLYTERVHLSWTGQWTSHGVNKAWAPYIQIWAPYILIWPTIGGVSHPPFATALCLSPNSINHVDMLYNHCCLWVQDKIKWKIVHQNLVRLYHIIHKQDWTSNFASANTTSQNKPMATVIENFTWSKTLGHPIMFTVHTHC
jgi:hypothetical protein